MEQTESFSVRSLYAEAYQLAQAHKWIESQKAGYDKGREAIEEWYTVHWPVFCREKRIEHLQGEQCWKEYEPEGFGRLRELIINEDLLTDRILDRVYMQQENLELINWALDWNLPMERVREILTLINVNGCRLEPKVDPEEVKSLV